MKWVVNIQESMVGQTGDNLDPNLVGLCRSALERYRTGPPGLPEGNYCISTGSTEVSLRGGRSRGMDRYTFHDMLAMQ